jgi:hypothetical protein
MAATPCACRNGAFVVKMTYLASALLVLVAPGLGSASSSTGLHEGALPVRLAAATTQQPSNSWTATASMSTARASLTATRLASGRVLVVGGE